MTFVGKACYFKFEDLPPMYRDPTRKLFEPLRMVTRWLGVVKSEKSTETNYNDLAIAIELKDDENLFIGKFRNSSLDVLDYIWQSIKMEFTKEQLEQVADEYAKKDYESMFKVYVSGVKVASGDRDATIEEVKQGNVCIDTNKKLDTKITDQQETIDNFYCEMCDQERPEDGGETCEECHTFMCSTCFKRHDCREEEMHPCEVCMKEFPNDSIETCDSCECTLVCSSCMEDHKRYCEDSEDEDDNTCVHCNKETTTEEITKCHDCKSPVCTDCVTKVICECSNCKVYLCVEDCLESHKKVCHEPRSPTGAEKKKRKCDPSLGDDVKKSKN